MEKMWLAARAHSIHKFKYFFDKVLVASLGIESTPSIPWASMFCDDIKCDYIKNNLAAC
jgi:hypothetical protein